MGKDEYDSDLFILGMGSHRKLIKKAVLSFLEHMSLRLRIFDDRYFKNVNFITKIGGLHPDD